MKAFNSPVRKGVGSNPTVVKTFSILRDINNWEGPAGRCKAPEVALSDTSQGGPYLSL